MDFGFLSPPPGLARLLQTVWYARGSKAEFDHAEPIVADGCVELVLNFADPFEQIDSAGDRIRQPRDLLVGPSLQPAVAVPTGAVDLLGLRFRPGRTSAFLRTPMCSLTDRFVPLSSVVSGAARLSDDLREQRADRRLNHLAQVFSVRADRSASGPASAVASALDAIDRRRGVVSIAAVASIAGVSTRHLERRFREEVGLGAKHVARLARIHHAIEVMQTRPAFTGADIAAHCGYTDQAHLIRECRELTGTTPSRLAASETTLAALMREK
jgi:AraC-like DNA-binding protein